MKLEYWIAFSFGNHHFLWSNRNFPVTRQGLWHCSHFTCEQTETLKRHNQSPAGTPARGATGHTAGREPSGGMWGASRLPAWTLQFLSFLCSYPLTHHVPQGTPPSRAQAQLGVCAERSPAQWWMTWRPGTPRERREWAAVCSRAGTAAACEARSRPLHGFQATHQACGPLDAKQKGLQFAVTWLVLDFPKGCP